MDNMPCSKRVTLLIPCYNEREVLPELVRRLDTVCAGLPQYVFFWLFIDDGSADGTREWLRRLAETDARVGVVVLSRNFGHQRALSAGFDYAGGDYVIVLDADLQDPPEVIPALLERLEAGYDVVHTVRADRSVDTWYKRIPARLFYRFMRRWVLPELWENAGDFKGLSRRAVEALRNFPERVRFLRGMFATLGYRQTQVYFTREARQAGTSKYPLWKVLQFARDAIVSYSVWPLRLGLILGILGGMVWGAILGIVVVLAVLGRLEFALLYAMVSSVGLMASVVLVFVGLTGEYFRVLMLEVKQRPLYLVSEVVNVQRAGEKMEP